MADYDDSNLGWYAKRQAARHAEEESQRLKEQEEAFAAMSPEDQELIRSGAGKLESGEGLNAAELAAYDKYTGLKGEDGQRSKPSKDINDRLNAGYTGAGGKKTRTSKFRNSNSKLKKRIAVAGAVAGATGIGGVAIFLIMLPFKIEHIITNIEARAGAQVADAVGNETERLFTNYVTKSILPALDTGACKSTIDPHCTVVADGTGPFARFRQALKQGKLEYKLATSKPSIIIAKDGNGYYMNIDNERVAGNTDFQDIRSGKKTLFQLDGTKRVSRSEIRAAIKDALKQGTLWDRTYTRFKVGKLLEQKYGIKRCLIACDLKDKISDTVDNKTLAGKAYLLQRILPEKYGLVLTCVLAGATGSCDPTFLQKAEPGDTERLTPFEKQLQQQLADYAARFGEKGLGDLVKAAQDISEKGLKKAIVGTAVDKIASTLIGDAGGQVAGQAAEKAVPVVGWIVFFAGLVSGAATLGILLSHAAYQGNAATAAETYQTFKTASDEAQSGNGDLRVLGSFSTILATNVSGSKDNSVDFTQSPLWQRDFSLNDQAAPATGFGSLFGIASADTAAGAGAGASEYRCDDGKPVPAGNIVCKEENFANDGLAAATAVSNVVNEVPGIVSIASWITNIGNKPSEWLGDGLQYLPGFQLFSDWTSSLTAGPLNWLENQLITTPNIESGARVVDMIMAGADVAMNMSCKVQLGCAKITDQQAANIQNEQLAEQKADFDRMPMFARIFSLDSPYSFVSRLAINMPSSFLGITSSSMASLFTNPLNRLSAIIPSLFSTNAAFAAASPQSDPFGVIQFGYTSIPADSEAYWDSHCVNGPLATYDSTTDTLDISDWLDQEQLDSRTGDAIPTTSNPCLLIQSSMQSMAGLFDASMLPQGSTNPDQ